MRSSVEQISGVLKISATIDLGEHFIVPVIREIQKKVVELLPHKPLTGFSIYGVYVDRSYLPKKISTFLDLMKEAFAEAVT